MSSPVHPHEEPGISSTEFLRLQEELRRTNVELAAANQALRTGEEQLEQRVRERTRELITLLQVSHNITTTLDLEPLLGQILDQLKQVVEYRLASISILEGEDDLLVLAARGEGMQPPGTRIPLSEHANTRTLLQARRPAFVPDLNADTRLAERMRGNLAARNLQGLGSWMSAPLVFRGQSIGVLALAHPSVNYYDPARVDLAMAFASQAAVAIANARSFATEQRRAEQFRVIGEVGRHITSLMAVDQLLLETERLIRENFGYYYISIGLVEGEDLVIKTDCPCDRPRLRIGEEGIMGWVAAHGRLLHVSDVSQDPRYISTVSSTRTHSEVALPIQWKDRIIGVLNVESDQLDAFDANDIAVLSALASQLAVAIENARLYEQARQLASLEERQKLARELHDSVSQALYGIALGTRTARALLERDPPRAAEPLDYVLSLAETGLSEMRALIFELRPESLQTEGLVAALGKLARALEARQPLEVRLEAGDEPGIQLDVKEALYRIAQEALNNIARHARARRVELRLRMEDGRLSLEIADDGAGFEAGREYPGHLGLHTMRERAEKHGGTLTVESAPGQGTRIRVSVPRRPEPSF